MTLVDEVGGARPPCALIWLKSDCTCSSDAIRSFERAGPDAVLPEAVAAPVAFDAPVAWLATAKGFPSVCCADVARVCRRALSKSRWRLLLVTEPTDMKRPREVPVREQARRVPEFSL
ncbi:hypothetical protein [Methylobacterium brachiatum]|uniref:Uncharacterized protein n=1 Tax=Methylobacterium brachiatum TaxID=269660 RepID=A0ABV1QZC8_9HYPH